MKVIPLLAVALLCGIAAPASAQYMFLDANGDGTHTDADKLNPNGTATTVDVYVTTNLNRDASAATCDVSAAQPLTINSYIVCLQGIGGTVIYSGFTTAATFAGTAFGEVNAGDGFYKNGTGTGTYQPPGKYKLCTLTITGSGGSPSVQIIDGFATSGGDITSFGSECIGTSGSDGTYRLDGPFTQSTFGVPGDWHDADGLSAAAGGNSFPVLSVPSTVTGVVGSPVTIEATATDADLSDVLTISQTNNAPFLTFTGSPSTSPAHASLSGTATALQTGSYTINWSVTDGTNPAVTATTLLTISEGTNNPPVLAAIGDKTVTETQTLTFTATATDPDAGETLTFTLENAPAGASIDPTTGVFTWTPSETQAGVYGVTVRVTDSGSPVLSDFETFQITVLESGGGNSCPVLAPIGNKTIDELTLLTFTATATDADAGQTLAFSLDAGSPAGASIDATTGVFTWTPTEAQGAGVYTITVRVTDNAATPCSDSEDIQVVVNEVSAGNQCPVLTPIGNKTVDEQTLLTFTVTATDPDAGQTLTYSLVPAPPPGTAIDPVTGVFTWTPTEEQGPGTYAVTIRVTDNGDPPCSVEETISITVNETPPTNTCPVLNPIGNQTVDEGTLLTFVASASDPDISTILTWSLGAGAPAGAAIDASNGTFTWTPTEDQGPGVYSITITVTDNGVPPCSDSETFVVTVNEVPGGNQCPVLSAIGNKTVDEGTLLTFTATATDPDAGQTLTFSLDPGFPTGAAIDPSTGVFTWTPTEAQGPGVYSVTIRVTDNGSTPCADFETIEITVNEVPGENQCPVLAPIGNKTVILGQTLTFTATATDADAGQTLTFSLDAGFPSGATIDASTGAFSWTPSTTGTFPITVRVTDNAAVPCSDSETIGVTVVSSGPGAVTVDAFFIGGNRTTRLWTGKPTTCVQIEVTSGDISTIDLSSITLSYGGHTISAMSAKLSRDSDRDGNPEITACFSKSDLRTLFDGLSSGTTTVELTVGGIANGAPFSAIVEHTVISRGVVTHRGKGNGGVNRDGNDDGVGARGDDGDVGQGDVDHTGHEQGYGNLRHHAVASPNPFNPSTVLAFTTSTAGHVVVKVFDIHGRLVRTLFNGTMPAGANTIPWDGSTANGAKASSGVYYFRIESPDGHEVVRAILMK
jgi:Putative Ig domain/FlgD Ig-like domain